MAGRDTAGNGEGDAAPPASSIYRSATTQDVFEPVQHQAWTHLEYRQLGAGKVEGVFSELELPRFRVVTESQNEMIMKRGALLSSG